MRFGLLPDIRNPLLVTLLSLYFCSFCMHDYLGEIIFFRSDLVSGTVLNVWSTLIGQGGGRSAGMTTDPDNSNLCS